MDTTAKIYWDLIKEHYRPFGDDQSRKEWKMYNDNKACDCVEYIIEVAPYSIKVTYSKLWDERISEIFYVKAAKSSEH